MKISVLFRKLAYGRLQNLSINNKDGTLKTAQHPQIIQYVNEGLLNLYSRFLLREKSLMLLPAEHITSYHLLRKYAVSSGSTEPYHYIRDKPGEPFLEDVIRILGCTDEFGRSFVLNDEANPNSFFTPEVTQLQIPHPEEGRPVFVTYQARYPELADEGEDLISQEIELPFSLESALENYIGYKAYCDMNGQDNIVKGQEYLGAYEAKCLEVEERNLANQSFSTSHTKLEERGFV